MNFKKITTEDIQKIRSYITYQDYRTCDFTVGGIYMWAEYFDYTYAIFEDMLVLKGQAETEMDITAFAMPVGPGDVHKALDGIAQYCRENKMPLEFSAVPENALSLLWEHFDCKVNELCDWSDYLYLSEDLKMLKGRRYNARRNHVNYFKRTYPGFEYKRITPADIPRLLEFCRQYYEAHVHKSPLFEVEHNKSVQVLSEYDALNLTGGILEYNGNIVALSIGEIVNDTLFVHVEKALRDYRGSYEMINMLFANDMAGSEDVKFINREEDVGDPGLRAAKKSYHPVALLKKYNVAIY